MFFYSKNMKYFCTIITILQICSIKTTSSSESSFSRIVPHPSKTDIFLGNLISEKFSHCSLLFLQDRYDNSETLNYIVEKTNLNYYNIKYDYPPDAELQLINSKLHYYHISALNLTSIINAAQSLPVSFKVSVANYHKKTDPCKVNLMMINDLRPEFMKQIHKMITPVYIPITKKDVDYFVFITKPEFMDKLLLMPEFPGRIKFKIAIGDSKAGISNGDLIIKSVCFFCGEEGSPQIVEYPQSGIDEYFPDYVINLNGKVLKVACPAILSRVETYGPPWKGVKNAKRGMWKTLFEEFLMVKFNFTYNIFLSTGKNGKFGGGGTGLELPDGTWIGNVGDVAAGRADLAIITAATPKRIRQVDFTNNFFDFNFLGLITSEGQRVYSPLALLWPFDIVMWGCIFLSTVFAFIVFTFLSKIMDYLGLDTTDAMSFARRGVVSKETWGFSHQIFFVLTTYLDQDCVMPRFQPLRCFVALWLFFTLILTTVYRSKLVSLLAFPVIEKLPQTFEELASSNYEVGFIKHGDSAYNTLKASDDPVYVKLLAHMEVITGIGLECLERVVARKYGCIAYDFSTIHLKSRNLSDSALRKLVFAPTTTYNIFMGLVTEGGSMYKSNFDKWLGNTRSFNLADKWEEWDMYYNVRLPKRAWWLATNQTEQLRKSDGEESSNLTLKHISGAFYILLVCLSLCFLVFLHEILKFYKKIMVEKVYFRFQYIIRRIRNVGAKKEVSPKFIGSNRP